MGVRKVNKLGVKIVKKGVQKVKKKGGEDRRKGGVKSKAEGLLDPEAQPRAWRASLQLLLARA